MDRPRWGHRTFRRAERLLEGIDLHLEAAEVATGRGEEDMSEGSFWSIVAVLGLRVYIPLFHIKHGPASRDSMVISS